MDAIVAACEQRMLSLKICSAPALGRQTVRASQATVTQLLAIGSAASLHGARRFTLGIAESPFLCTLLLIGAGRQGDLSVIASPLTHMGKRVALACIDGACGE